jgi:hypothetical protein
MIDDSGLLFILWMASSFSLLTTVAALMAPSLGVKVDANVLIE